MKKLISSCLILLSFFSANLLNAQVAKQSQWSGVPCADCVNNSSSQKSGSNSVQNGNGVVATSYTVSACGLGFVTATQRLNQRAFTGMTTQKGVLQPATFNISGIPPCFTIVKAFLYTGGSGNGVAITANITNPLLVAGSYPMTMIGSHTDKCWGYTGTYNYRADVTAAISGNGNYIISGIPCLGTTPNDMDGATLIVMYTDPTQTFTGHMVIGDGCHEVSGGNCTDILTGFKVCGAANSTQNFVIVSDLQQIAATPIMMNSAAYNYTFASASNTVWDYIQQPGAPATSGQTSAQYGFSNSSDCYNFVAAGMYYRTACQVCTAASNLTVTAVTSASCAAGSATATVSGGTGPYSYTWSPTGGNSATVTGVPTGNYTVTVKDATGCKTGTAVVSIVSAATPTLTFAGTTTICAGQSTNLTVTGASTYTWSPGATLNTTIGSAVTATPPLTTTYSVSATSTAGCVVTKTIQVVVNPLPVPVVGSNSPLCAGQTLNLTSTGGGTYSWTGPSAFSSTLQNPTVPAVTSANAGVYTVTVTTLGCTGVGTVNVVVNTPTSSASNTGPYCAGQTIQLNTPAATSFTWSGPAAYSSNAQNPTIPASTAAMTGVYSVTASTGGCISTATTMVTVNALPVPAPTNTGPYCPGNTIQLNVGAFTTYTWSGPSAFSSNAQNPTIPNAQTTNGGVYTVIVSNAAGCTNTANTTVVVNPSPVIVIGSNSPVCINTSINLTSTGGGTYSWTGPNAFTSTLQNPTIPAATAVNAGIYNVIVTTLGCTSTASVNVIVTTPTTSASNTGPYCAGTTINLSASAATSYTWSGPLGYSSNSQNATQASSTPAMSGTYTVIVSIGTCTASATTNVVVNALPTPLANSNSPICAGQTLNLTGTGGTTYTWTGPAFNSNLQNPSITNANASNSGNYVLTVSDANGCKNTANVNVIVNPLPTIVVANPTTCVNTNINLTSNGGVTYAWTGPGGFTSNVQNPVIPAAQLNMSGTYVVTVTDVNGCVNTANASVSVLPLPTPNITSNSPVCAGNTLNLFGTGGAVYAWSGPGYVGAAQNPVINNVTAVANGVYTLLVSSGTCTASTTYTVVINPVPVFNFAGSNVLCFGQSNGTSTVNVTVGTGPFTYQWNTTPIQTTQVASNIPAGNYSCLVTDANGCSSIASTQITQPTLFTVSINSATLSACANSPINVNANGSGGTGPYTYNWTAGPTTAGYSITETVSGNYNYVVNAVDAFNCPATANINLTFFPQPTVTATSATLCAGQTNAVLVASGATSYVWQPGNVTGSTYPYNGNTSLNVTVIGTSNGCSNSANAAILVNPTPNVNITVGNVKGCVPTCIDFSAAGNSNITSYGWMLNGAGITGSVNGAYCFSEAASYTLGLTVMDSNGCTGTVVPVTIDIYPQPVADFNHAPIKPIINQDPFVTFTDASWGANIVSWNWYFMNTAQFTSTQQNPTFMYTEPGTYPVALVVTSDKGCMDTIVRPIVVGEDFGIYAPNAFTPNDDGLNDIFQPKGFGVVKYELNIFDRWGEKVFSTTTFEQGWDGTFHGRGQKICKEDSYTWLINCTDVFGKSHELNGHVTLIR